MIVQFQTFGDPILDLGVFALKDDHWKHVRSILTPTFSSGKLRKVSEINNNTLIIDKGSLVTRVLREMGMVTVL